MIFTVTVSYAPPRISDYMAVWLPARRGEVSGFIIARAIDLVDAAARIYGCAA